MIKRYRTEPQKGVGINIICDDRFKSEYFSVSFLTPLKSQENTISYILPSLLLRGCEKYPSALSLGRALQRAYDTELSAESYRMGNAKILRFGVAFLSEKYTHKPILNEVFELLGGVILKPLRESNGSLSENFTELEKKSVIEIIKTRTNNKKSFSLSKCKEMLLEGDEVGASRYGTLNDAENTNAKLITEFYENMLRDAAIEFFYEGSKNPEEVIDLINAFFKDIITQKKTTPAELGKFIPAKTVPYQELTESSDSEQSLLCMGFETPHRESDDYSPRLFAEILATSSVSRFFMNIREEMGLCYFCDYLPISHKDRAIIQSGLEYSKIPDARDAILGEISDIGEGNISDYELSAAKASLINAYRGVEDSPTSIESWEIASTILGRYISPEEVIKKIENIDPTEIASYAQGLKLSVVYVLKEEM